MDKQDEVSLNSETHSQFLDDLTHKSQLRPNTLRAYRYELAAAIQDSRFQIPLQALELNIIEDWIGRDRPAASTRSRRAATFNRFFRWAIQQGLCERNPLDGRMPTRSDRRLPRPIQKQTEQDAIDDAIRSAPQPYRLIFTILHQWQKVCQVAGLIDDGKPRYTLHQLRHTRGSELLAQGQSIEIVQRVLGHRDIHSTLLYAELNEDQVRAALEQPPS